MIPVCKHCRIAKVNRPRGLCWTCYYTPGVKDQYPSTSKYARRGLGNFNGNAPLPEPTPYPPGTPEKMAVLELRAQLQQALWHPLDAQYDGDPNPLAEILKRRAALASFLGGFLGRRLVLRRGNHGDSERHEGTGKAERGGPHRITLRIRSSRRTAARSG
jgi:hypothetical protein